MKIFVLDTNVLLFDTESINAFENNIIVIPTIVLEELDKLKNGSFSKNYSARVIIRKLTELMENSENPIDDGIQLKNGGILYIRPDIETHKDVIKAFANKKADHEILSFAKNLQDVIILKHMTQVDIKNVILVTKDINLRVKALSIGINAEDYTSGKLDNLNSIIKETEYVNVTQDFINELYENGKLEKDKYDIDLNVFENHYFIAHSGNASALCKLRKDKIIQVKKHRVFNVVPLNAEQTFLLDALIDDEIKVIAITGCAGSGKTILTIAAALEKSKDKQYDVIMVARPDISMSDKSQGFLPGNIHEKILPFMLPLFDNLNAIKKINKKSSNAKTIDNLQAKDKLIIEPLATIRGRSIADTFFIIDESQNLTPHEVKTIITRAGENTKIIFTGDIKQIDARYLDDKSNGLSHLIHKMRGVDFFSHVHLIKSERSEVAEVAAKLL